MTARGPCSAMWLSISERNYASPVWLRAAEYRKVAKLYRPYCAWIPRLRCAGIFEGTRIASQTIEFIKLVWGDS